MATLKAIVKSKAKNGMYHVYIRITQNRQFSYVRTSAIEEYEISYYGFLQKLKLNYNISVILSDQERII